MDRSGDQPRDSYCLLCVLPEQTSVAAQAADRFRGREADTHYRYCVGTTSPFASALSVWQFNVSRGFSISGVTVRLVCCHSAKNGAGYLQTVVIIQGTR